MELKYACILQNISSIWGLGLGIHHHITKNSKLQGLLLHNALIDFACQAHT